MKIFVDTNVLIDYLVGREPYFETADKIIQICCDKIVTGFMAAHSVPNLFFILRKDYDHQTRRIMIKSLFDILEVSGIGKNVLLTALERLNFKDFEDCLQDECAVAVNADYIVTRNINDFANSKIKAITPQEFLEIYKKTKGSGVSGE